MGIFFHWFQCKVEVALCPLQCMICFESSLCKTDALTQLIGLIVSKIMTFLLQLAFSNSQYSNTNISLRSYRMWAESTVWFREIACCLIFDQHLKQSQKTQRFCVAHFATLSDDRSSRSKIFPLFIWIKEPCVRKFKGFQRLKRLGISQTRYLFIILQYIISAKMVEQGLWYSQ